MTPEKFDELDIEEGDLIMDPDNFLWEVVDDGTGFLRCAKLNSNDRTIINPDYVEVFYKRVVRQKYKEPEVSE
jgi:hypothetical protein